MIQSGDFIVHWTKTRFIRQLKKFFLILSLLVSFNTFSDIKNYPEAKIKAAYLYNFLRFVEWPVNQKSTSDICIYGVNKEYKSVFSSMATLSKQGKKLTIKFFEKDNEFQPLTDCQIIFITSEANSKTKNILDHLKNNQILTIGESDDFINQGGMINFIRVGNKIRFEINVDAIEQAELKISSKVLRIAERLFSKNHL